MSYKTPEAVKYRSEFTKYVEKEVESQGWDVPIDKGTNIYVDAVFYFPRIDMDCNNYWKILLDAITDTQLIWKDDNVVCERVQRIYYDSNNPRIELVIHPVSYIGVFDDAPQLEAFVSNNCIGCSRYKRNCSILQKAMDGKVQDELKDMVCSKRKLSKDFKEEE